MTSSVDSETARRLVAQGGLRRRAILVLGMHRSGTSALTRLLALCGADLPQRLMAPNFANPTGYWEPAGLVDLHDEMLAAAGSAWNDTAGFPLNWLDTAEGQAFRSRLRSAFQEAFADAPLALLKDPRICQFVPLWISILASLDIEPFFVIPVRNPLEVAASLKARDESGPATPLGKPVGMAEAKALLLWLRCFLDAERDTRGFPRSFVSYDALMSDWRAVMARMAGDLGLAWPVSPDHIASQAADFLAPDMRHHVSSSAALEERGDVAVWIKEAFRWACHAANGQPGDTRELDRLRDGLRLADMLFQPVLAANRGENERAATARAQQIAERDALVAKLRRDLGAAEVFNGALADGIAERDRMVAALRRDLAASEEGRSALAGGIAERDGVVAALRRDLAASEEGRGALAGGIVERDGMVAELRRDLAASEEGRGALAGGIAERDGMVAELRRDLAASEERRGALAGGILERDAVIAELRDQIAAANGQVSSLREELDERMRTLHAMQRQLSEAAARFTERLLELRRSAGSGDAGAASPASGSTDTGKN